MEQVDKPILCDTCRFLWSMMPDYTSPYGEYACTKLECDLYGENVTECEHFEKKCMCPIQEKCICGRE
jgi:hypothetical protein